MIVSEAARLRTSLASLADRASRKAARPAPRAAAMPRDARHEVRMRRYLMAAATSLLAMGVLLAWHLLGMLQRGPLLLLEGLILCCMLAFYGAFRTGWNRRAADPSLTLHQMSAASLTLLVGAYAADGGRAVFLVLFMMVLVFGVLRLRTRALLAYTGCIVACHAGVIGLLWTFKPATLDLRLELLQLLVFAVAMPWLALMGGYIGGLRERLRRALRTVEDRERTLAEAQRLAQFGSWSFDPATSEAVWSAETYRIFGLDPAVAALSGAQFRALVHEEDRERYMQLIDKAIGECRELDTEYRIALPSGAVRWVHALAQPAVGRNGRTTMLRGTVMDITERKQAEDRIRQLAHFDTLTGLPNRNLLMQLLRHAIARAQRRSTPLAVLFIDLDGFKNVNDTQGHEAGDLLLAAFAQRLGRCLRISDVAARLGGDEFIVVVDDFDGPAGLEAIADRVLVAAGAPFRIQGNECLLSASIGMACYPEGGADIDLLIKHADSAMYDAKREGRNRCRLWRAQA